MSEKRRRGEGQGSTADRESAEPSELKFLLVHTESEIGGGWYRELDDTQIEVLTRAKLERVHVESSRDAETTARGKIVEMMSKPRDAMNDKAH
jgi:hypothetical protein